MNSSGFDHEAFDAAQQTLADPPRIARSLEDLSTHGALVLHPDASQCLLLSRSELVMSFWSRVLRGETRARGAVRHMGLYRKTERGWVRERLWRKVPLPLLGDDFWRGSNPDLRLADTLTWHDHHLALRTPLPWWRRSLSIPWPRPWRPDASLRAELLSLVQQADPLAVPHPAKNTGFGEEGFTLRVHPRLKWDSESNDTDEAKLLCGPGGLSLTVCLSGRFLQGMSEPHEPPPLREQLSESERTAEHYILSQDREGALMVTLTHARDDAEASRLAAAVMERIEAFARTWRPGLADSRFCTPKERVPDGFPQEAGRLEDVVDLLRSQSLNKHNDGYLEFGMHSKGHIALLVPRKKMAAVYRKTPSGWKLSRVLASRRDLKWFEAEDDRLRAKGEERRLDRILEGLSGTEGVMP